MALTDMKSRVDKPINFIEADTTVPEIYPFLSGLTAVFTRCAPDKESPNNEDTAALIPVSQDTGVLIVADGLGGQPSGQQASRIVIEVLTKTISSVSEPNNGLREVILNGIEQANKQICTLGTGAATTLVVVELQKTKMRCYHIGDSIALLVGQRGKIKYQSVPHSPVSYAVEAGLLSENEAVHHEDRNLVSNVVGAADMSVEIGPLITLAPKDTLILASDGLVDNLYVNEIIDRICCGPLDSAAINLVNCTHERMTQPQKEYPSHSDDLTFILYRPR